ncbi:aminoglycoside phosphotransferase family protein [Saccharibacillus sp. CPCC 101409]|uniref:phosphotransferase family protein n=1 Tax=Saccharibacillus sp. CPCC 101409 TaxID=3058041 RepID=UPI002673BC88|nr:aminoglycoside phosphotransferase family protein [Saccharibacillus sp. CPCC 101409]MDO3410869.1 aminoglycoside phosphotransferase family protein [Saccharibacillus sp. CPCC 101409]
MELIGTGGTAEVFIQDSGHVLKLFREWFSEPGIRSEYRKTQWANRQGIPSARTIGLIEAEGRRGMLLERIEGETLLAKLHREPESVDDAAAEFAGMQVRLHSREARSLDDSQRQRLVQRIPQAPGLDEDEKSAVLAQLERLPDGDRLCHGDYHPGNIIVPAGGGEWRIIDWIDSNCGHPLYDAARTLLLIGFGTEAGGPREAMQDAAVRFRESYLRTYTELSGFSIEEVERWLLPVAAARLPEPIPETEKTLLRKLVKERLALL